MTKAPYTAKELAEFDRITRRMCSLNQMARIEGRVECRKFEAEHGKEKCDAMFAELQRRDKAGGRA